MKLLGDTSVWSLALRRKDAGSLSHDEQELKAQLAQAIQRAELTNAAAGQQDAIGKFQTIIGRRSHHRAGPPYALRTGSKDNIGLR